MVDRILGMDKPEPVPTRGSRSECAWAENTRTAEQPDAEHHDLTQGRSAFHSLEEQKQTNKAHVIINQQSADLPDGQRKKKVIEFLSCHSGAEIVLISYASR